MKLKLPRAIKTIGFITVAIALSKLLGLLRESIFAHNYGATSVVDAYNVSSNMPLVFFDVALGTAVLSSFIPVFSDILHKKDKETAFAFANAFFNLIFFIALAITVVVLLFPQAFISLMAPDLVNKTLAVHLLYILFPSLIFTALAYVFVGILQSLDEFNIPAIISIVSNLVIIVYLLFFDKFGGIYGVAWAILIGWSMQMFVQIPSLIKKGYRWRPTLHFEKGTLKTIAIMALPILISSWVQPICVVINTRFASSLGEGIIASLNYANKLYILLTGIFSFAITNYIFPKMSAAASENNWSEYKSILNKALKAIVAIMLPITLLTMFLATPLIKILFFRGAFDLEAVARSSTALFFYSFGMVALGVNEILNKSLFARKRTKISMFGSITGILANLLSLLIFSKLGALTISTLALSVAIGSNANMIFLLIANKFSQQKIPIQKERNV